MIVLGSFIDLITRNDHRVVIVFHCEFAHRPLIRMLLSYRLYLYARNALSDFLIAACNELIIN